MCVCMCVCVCVCMCVCVCVCVCVCMCTDVMDVNGCIAHKLLNYAYHLTNKHC